MSSQKRRDKKGRILQDGERQRSNGMYEFRYTDASGNRRSLYSWKLVETDRAPNDKDCVPLRDQEKQLRRAIDSGIDVAKAKTITLDDLFEQHMALKMNLKQSTRTRYYDMYNTYISGAFGKKLVSDIRYSDVKRLYVNLMNKRGLRAKTIMLIHVILGQVMKAAQRDQLITVNPTDGVIAEIKQIQSWEVGKRPALTIEEQAALIDFCAATKYKKWMPLITTLLGTGCRIGEALGLQICDCDFDAGVISIRHTIAYQKSDSGEYEYVLTKPKSKTSVRTIPMLDEVRDALMVSIGDRSTKEKTGAADEYENYVFRSIHNTPLAPQSFYRALVDLVKAYNEQEAVNAAREARDPLFLHNVSPHTFRHTFCTRFCENEPNIKVIQAIMGHSDISITMNTYAEATATAKQDCVTKLQGKIKLT